MVVPSRSVASTFVGNCACSLGSAVRKCESRPGRTFWTARRSSLSAADSCSVHTLPQDVRCSVTFGSAGAGLH